MTFADPCVVIGASAQQSLVILLSSQYLVPHLWSGD